MNCLTEIFSFSLLLDNLIKNLTSGDVVMFLYREETEQENWGEQIMTKLRVSKHRNGPLGEIDLIFRGDRIRFYGIEKKRDEKPPEEPAPTVH